ncbi:MAG: TonB-dependent receptor [Gammaproteobacteria bacterium]|nr:TonB-dependent receptor [Gammaproteobacteria bacterium]
MQNNTRIAAIAASLSTLLVVLPTASLADQVQAAADDISDNKVIVTATRTANNVDQVLATSMLITRKEIQESQSLTVADILRTRTGIDIASNGGPGQTTSVFIRGAESDHTLIMIDGVKMNPGTIGVASIQNIPLNMVERIEIIMGPRSTLYGSDALGGVIQIFTRRGETAEAGWRFGSFNTQELSASYHRRDGNRRMGIDLSSMRTDGFPARMGANDDSPYKNDSINLKLGSTFGSTDLDFQVLKSRGRTDYYDFFLTPVAQDYSNTVSSLIAKIKASETWISKIKVSFFEDEIKQRQSMDFLKTRRYELDWQNDIAIGSANLLTAGVQAYQENAQSLSFGRGFDEDTDTVGLYVQDQFESGTNQLTAGLRYTDHSSFDGKTTGELSYGYQANQATKLIASFATGFRAPGSTDRFGFGGNPDLKPETSQNLELSARFNPSSVHRGRISLYQNEIDNLINYVDPDGFGGPVPGRNENIDKTRTRGIELSYSFNKGPYVVDAGVTYQDPKDLSTGRQLARRAKEKYNLIGRYVGSDYSASAELSFTGERPDSAFSNVVLDAYTLLNLSARKSFSKLINVGIRLENITDEDYQLADGFNTAGRAVFLDLRYTNRP